MHGYALIWRKMFEKYFKMCIAGDISRFLVLHNAKMTHQVLFFKKTI